MSLTANRQRKWRSEAELGGVEIGNTSCALPTLKTGPQASKLAISLKHIYNMACVYAKCVFFLSECKGCQRRSIVTLVCNDPAPQT